MGIFAYIYHKKSSFHVGNIPYIGSYGKQYTHNIQTNFSKSLPHPTYSNQPISTRISKFFFKCSSTCHDSLDKIAKYGLNYLGDLSNLLLLGWNNLVTKYQQDIPVSLNFCRLIFPKRVASGIVEGWHQQQSGWFGAREAVRRGFSHCTGRPVLLMGPMKASAFCSGYGRQNCEKNQASLEHASISAMGPDQTSHWPFCDI